MALLQDLDGGETLIATSQVTFPKCYCRVAEPVDMGKDICRIKMEWWFSEAVRNEGGKQPIHTSLHCPPGIATIEFQMLVNEAGGDMVKALYNWLKTQPEFVGAIDA